MRIETNYAIYEKKDEIIFGYYCKPVFVDSKAAEEIKIVLRSMAKEYKIPSIVVIGKDFKGFSREASKVLSSEECTNSYSCCGLVLDSYASYIIAKIFLLFGDPIIPIRVFNSIEEARWWTLNMHFDIIYGSKKEE